MIITATFFLGLKDDIKVAGTGYNSNSLYSQNKAIIVKFINLNFRKSERGQNPL